jgi:hypothetical protein
MRTHKYLYHMNCFKCLNCEKQLQTGEEFGMRKDGSVYCRLHYFDDNSTQDDLSHQQQQQQQTTNNYYQSSSSSPFIHDSYFNTCNLPPTPNYSPPSGIQTQQLQQNTLDSPYRAISPPLQQQLNAQETSNQPKGRPKKRKLNDSNTKRTKTPKLQQANAQIITTANELTDETDFKNFSTNTNTTLGKHANLIILKEINKIDILIDTNHVTNIL